MITQHSKPWPLLIAVSAAALFIAAIIPAARRRPDRAVAGVAVAYAFTVLLFVLANKSTTSANAIFLQDTAPLWVLLLSPVLLHERPSRGELLSAPLFLVGLVLFFLDQLSPGQAVGNVIAVASGVAFALCIMGLRKLGGRNVGAIVWGNALAALLSLPMALRGPAPTTRDLGIVLFLGVLEIKTLPVEQFPSITPPTVEAAIAYPGASANVLVDSVLIPLEQSINGVQNMRYIVSDATSAGEATIRIYFEPGTDPDIAVVNVQNRVNIVLNRVTPGSARGV